MALLATLLALGACSAPEERAARYQQKAQQLLAAGDLVNAQLEFRNALQVQPRLAASWMGLAEIAERQRDWQAVIGHLNKVVENDPKHTKAQLKLGRLLLAGGVFDQALAASEAALALAPDDLEVLALRAAILYKLEDRPASVAQANAVLARDPRNVDALVVLATERLDAGDGPAAVTLLDRGLAVNERNIALQLFKIQALASIAEFDEAEAVIHRLITFYPEERALRHLLASLYLTQQRPADAEAEYRALSDKYPDDVEARLDVVRFVARTRGAAAAQQELRTFVAQDPGNNELQFALAASQQTAGDVAAAAGTVRAIVAREKDSRDGLRAKGLLAGMHLEQGERAAAEALIAEVLARDPRNEQALVLRASLAIEDRRLDEAIADLRTVLRDVPDSARSLLLLARAHELAGARELATEHYLKAFQVGRMAPGFGVPYAELLLRHGQFVRLEAVAQGMLRAEPGNLAALRLLAQARINQGNWVGAQEVADELQKRSGLTAESQQILGAVAAARRDFEQSIAAFRLAVDAAPSDSRPMVSLVRAYFAAGKTQEALQFLNSVLKASPDNASARLLKGQVLMATGDLAAAATEFEAVIETAPGNVMAYVSLANLRVRAGEIAAADAVLVQGLQVVPGDFSLDLTRAAVYEVAGHFDEAIAIYERLIAARPNADIVANNLASLLADHRSDPHSHARARELTERFRDSPVPQFRDSLGWASYRVGKADEAVSLISDAAEQLELPVFRYHLGMSYLALGRRDDGRTELERALALGQGQDFPDADKVKEALGAL